MKTQDNKTILIELYDEGWKFTSLNNKISYETGLYFGNKNNFVENQNILITGKTSEKKVLIHWEFEKTIYDINLVIK